MLFDILCHCEWGNTYCGQFWFKMKMVKVKLRVVVSDYDELTRGGRNRRGGLVQVIESEGKVLEEEKFREICSKRPLSRINQRNLFHNGASPET